MKLENQIAEHAGSPLQRGANSMPGEYKNHPFDKRGSLL
jgi:hypothetical protein